MANIVWPDDLPPAPVLAGYQEVAPTTVLRTQMDAGAPKMRRRFSAAPRPLKCALSLSKEEVELLDVFFNETCEGGADRFEWVHPRTGETVEMRFTQPPQYVPQADNLWTAQLVLEIMPA